MAENGSSSQEPPTRGSSSSNRGPAAGPIRAASEGKANGGVTDFLLGARDAPGVGSCSPANCGCLRNAGANANEIAKLQSAYEGGSHPKRIEIFEEVRIAQRYSESRGVR